MFGNVNASSISIDLLLGQITVLTKRKNDAKEPIAFTDQGNLLLASAKKEVSAATSATNKRKLNDLNSVAKQQLIRGQQLSTAMKLPSIHRIVELRGSTRACGQEY